MVGDPAAFARPFRPAVGAQIGDAENVVDELGELVDAGRQSLRFRQEYGVVVEQLGVEDPDHARAGARWDHDAGLRAERREQPLRNGLGIAPEAGVEGGLPAAGLGRRKVHVRPQAPQHPDYALAHLRVELVDDAGDEERCADRHPITALGRAL